MINKITIIFLIIFNLIIFKAFGEDQINFDVSEIEILDGGDKIIGKNRGIITTNNGIIIEADEFEFDKIANFLKAKGNILIKDQLNDYELSAQNISYDKNKEKIQIKGKAEALIDNNFEFKTEDATILRDEMIISSDIGASILDKINQSRYEVGSFNYAVRERILKGEKIFINTKYNQPFSDKYFFKSAILILKIKTILLKT